MFKKKLNFLSIFAQLPFSEDWNNIFMVFRIEEKFCFDEGGETDQQQNVENEKDSLADVYSFEQTLLDQDETNSYSQTL